MKHHHKEEWRKMQYEKADMNDKMIINLRDLSHTMRFLYEGKGSQKRILIILNEMGESTTQQQLTERLGIQPGSASEVIAKLESAGYIQRTVNERDRRMIDIRLTDRGKAEAVEAGMQRHCRHEQMFSCLSDSEKQQFLSLLEKIDEDWKQRYQDVPKKGHPRRKKPWNMDGE